MLGRLSRRVSIATLSRVRAAFRQVEATRTTENSFEKTSKTISFEGGCAAGKIRLGCCRGNLEKLAAERFKFFLVFQVRLYESGRATRVRGRGRVGKQRTKRNEGPVTYSTMTFTTTVTTDERKERGPMRLSTKRHCLRRFTDYKDRWPTHFRTSDLASWEGASRRWVGKGTPCFTRAEHRHFRGGWRKADRRNLA